MVNSALHIVPEYGLLKNTFEDIPINQLFKETAYRTKGSHTLLKLSTELIAFARGLQPTSKPRRGCYQPTKPGWQQQFGTGESTSAARSSEFTGSEFTIHRQWPALEIPPLKSAHCCSQAANPSILNRHLTSSIPSTNSLCATLPSSSVLDTLFNPITLPSHHQSCVPHFLQPFIPGILQVRPRAFTFSPSPSILMLGKFSYTESDSDIFIHLPESLEARQGHQSLDIFWMHSPSHIFYIKVDLNMRHGLCCHSFNNSKIPYVLIYLQKQY